MEAFLAGRVAAIGLDEEAFVPYIAGLLEEEDGGGEDVRELLTTALENAGAENFGSFVEEALQWREAKGSEAQQEEERRKREAIQAAEKALQASKVLRGDRKAAADVSGQEETMLERKKRLELLARYDVPDEIVMDDTGKVIVRDTSEKGGGGGGVGVDGNDNAERVKQGEAEKRAKQKAESQKQKELSKTSAYDGKKKKEEAKEKRRQKAVKVERKRN